MPCLGQMTSMGESERLAFFERNAVKKLLVPALVDGESIVELVRLFVQEASPLLERVDSFDLESSSAAWLSQLTDVVLGMSALVGKPALALRNLRQIETLHENAGRTGTSMLAQIATAVQRNTFSKAKLGDFSSPCPRYKWWYPCYAR